MRKNPENIFIAICILPLILWAFKDNSVWAWDQSWYGEESVHNYYLFLNDRSEWISHLLNQFGTRAPAIAWLGQIFVPLGFALGKVETGLLLFLTLCHFLTLWFVYHSAKKLTTDPIIATAITVMAASTPLFIGLGQQFFVEAIQLTSAAYFFFLASASRSWHPIRIFGHLLLAIAFAMSAKISTPLYVWFPGLIILFNLYNNYRNAQLHERDTEKKLSPVYILIVGCFFLSLISLWYFRNISEILTFLKSTSSGDIAALYGSQKSLSEGIAFWMRAIQWSFFIPVLGAITAVTLLIGFLCSLVFKSGNDKSSTDRKNRHCFLTIVGCFLQIVVVVVVFSRQTNEETRYLLPLLPSLVLLCAGLLSLSPSRLPAFVIIALAFFQWGKIHAYSLFTGDKPAQISNWVTKVQLYPDAKQALKVVDAFLLNDSTNMGTVIILTDIKDLNHNVLSFYSAQMRIFKGMRLHYRLPGWAQTDLQSAIDIIQSEQIRAPFVITVKKDLLPNPADQFNKVAHQLHEYVHQHPDFELVDFPNNRGILIYRNTRFYPKPKD